VPLFGGRQRSWDEGVKASQGKRDGREKVVC